MTLVEVAGGMKITGVEIPKEVYWVVASPTPLAGMKYPRSSFPWSSLKAAGFGSVVSLHPDMACLRRHRQGRAALNPRGELYWPENIQERLALRNFLDELCGTGERTGSPAALDNTDRKRFADQLDRFLARH